MKKGLLIAGGCSLVGLALMAVALLGTRNLAADFSTKTVASERQEYVCSNEIKFIEADITSDNLEIRTGDVDTVCLTYYDRPEYYEYEISESGDTLKIRYKDLNGPVHFVVDIGYVPDEPVTITVPESFAGKADLNSSSGSIYAENLTVSSLDIGNTSGSISVIGITSEGKVNLTNTSGSISVERLDSAGLKASNTSGGITIEDADIRGDLQGKSSSGSIRLISVSAEGDVNISNTSGSRTLEDVTAANISAEGNSGSFKAERVSVSDSLTSSTTSGSTRFEELSAGHSIKITASSGSVSGSITGSEDDFSIIASTTSGSCNLTNSREGDKTLDISTTSGSVNIDFTE